MSDAKKTELPEADPGTTGDLKPADSHMTGEPALKPLGDSHMTGEPTAKPMDSHMTGSDPR
ncbi:hypothetical protein EES43_16880 [Streptomyces sp. ADI96-02]|uniref:hypothetical protein n=1 Tax=unclassified Streptomyces TaxID=2593676 RepID=UPI000F54E081|nr:hypothetical protein [Streptomyces sp. ADI96-02]RPK60639.1 hypothetical protein EES43_16880 [Streptomyces sp. ADI96-02]